MTYSWNIYRHMFTDSRFNDLAAWRAYLAEQKAAGTPVQVTESLVRTDSTVFVLQSLPSLITAQEGVNTVSGDADEIEIGYNKSLTVAYEELKNAILAIGGNV